MKLYLDLNKSVQVPNTATDTISGDRAARAHKESFSRHSSGVAGGDPTTDDPQQGGKWAHDDEESEDSGEDTKRDSQIAKDKGIAEKACGEASDILKSFTSLVNSQVRSVIPDDAEVEYLTQFCYGPSLDSAGNRMLYSKEDVLKGRATIGGYERGRFNEWLNSRFQKSVEKLAR